MRTIRILMMIISINNPLFFTDITTYFTYTKIDKYEEIYETGNLTFDLI